MGSYCVARLAPSRHEHFRIAPGGRGDKAPLAFTADTSDKISTMFVELLDGLNRAGPTFNITPDRAFSFTPEQMRAFKSVTGKQAIADADLLMHSCLWSKA
jgi:hypothetical protein